jgi:hypothetical protein
MPELPVIQNLNRTVLRLQPRPRCASDGLLSATLRFIRQGKGSIPTAPTIHLPDGWTLNKNMRGKKGQIRPMIRFGVFFCGAGDNRISEFF